MKIVTIIDNLVYDSKLTAEHGFSLYLEKDNKKILFDTGQTGRFINNAKILGINISDIDAVVLSHGHYDHTGGLLEFVKYNRKAWIYAKKDIFLEKYKDHNQYIGIPFDQTLFSDRMVFIDKTTEFGEDIFIVPEITIFNQNDTHFDNMLIKKGDTYHPDEFLDEQFLVVKKSNSLIIITGCSHRGVTNIIKAAVDYFNLEVEMLIGGFHFRSKNDEYVEKIIDNLKKFNIQNIGVSHCTGVDKYCLMKKRFGEKVFYNYTGKIIN